MTVTKEQYFAAINRLAAGVGQLEPNGRECAICGDGGHQAWECHHNTLRAIVFCDDIADRCEELHDILHHLGGMNPGPAPAGIRVVMPRLDADEAPPIIAALQFEQAEPGKVSIDNSDKRRWNHATNGRGEEQPENKRLQRKSGTVSQGGFCRCGAWFGVLGLEPVPELYVEHIVRRVLRDDGTVWLNLGDSYSNDTKWGGTSGGKNYTSAAGGYQGQRVRRGKDCDPKRGPSAPGQPLHHGNSGLKPKDLVGIPWRVAFALQADGWWLRQDIVWHKPNVMPESVEDRCTKAHEYIFLLSKSERYYFNFEAIKEPASPDTHRRTRKERAADNHKSMPTDQRNGIRPAGVGPKASEPGSGTKYNASFSAAVVDLVEDRNKRSVWSVPTRPYKDAHFATFPPDLITPCILAGCPVGGIVLEPFLGSGTTAHVADKNGCGCIGIELNPQYLKLANKRLAQRRLDMEASA